MDAPSVSQHSDQAGRLIPAGGPSSSSIIKRKPGRPITETDNRDLEIRREKARERQRRKRARDKLIAAQRTNEPVAVPLDDSEPGSSAIPQPIPQPEEPLSLPPLPPPPPPPPPPPAVIPAPLPIPEPAPVIPIVHQSPTRPSLSHAPSSTISNPGASSILVAVPPSPKQMSEEEMRKEKVRRAARERQRKHRALVKARRMTQMDDMPHMPPGDYTQHTQGTHNDPHHMLMQNSMMYGNDYLLQTQVQAHAPAPAQQPAPLPELPPPPPEPEPAQIAPQQHQSPLQPPPPIRTREIQIRNPVPTIQHQPPLPPLPPPPLPPPDTNIPMNFGSLTVQAPAGPPPNASVGHQFAYTLMLALTCAPMLKEHTMQKLSLTESDLNSLKQVFAGAYDQWDHIRRMPQQPPVPQTMVQPQPPTQDAGQVSYAAAAAANSNASNAAQSSASAQPMDFFRERFQRTMAQSSPYQRTAAQAGPSHQAAMGPSRRPGQGKRINTKQHPGTTRAGHFQRRSGPDTSVDMDDEEMRDINQVEYITSM